MSTKTVSPSIFDIVVPCDTLAGLNPDREFIVISKSDSQVTVKDFFSGRRHTTTVNGFNALRAGTSEEIAFAKMPY